MSISTETIASFSRKVLHVDYIQQMVNYYCLKHPEVDRKQVIQTIATKVMSRVKENPIMVTVDGETLPLHEVDDTIVKQGLIVTGKGNLYKNQHEATNLAAAMIQYLLDERKVQKNKMFQAMRESNHALVNRFDSGQKTFKVLNNSYFGASIEPNSIFYNPWSGDSIMSSGRDVITTAVDIFERWLANNIYFRDVTDCITYAREVFSDYTRDFDAQGITFKQLKSAQSVTEYLLSKTDDYTESDKELLLEYLTAAAPSEEAVNLIYYKNNVHAFMLDSNVIEFLKPVLGRSDFLDPNEVPEDIKDNMSTLWSIFSTYTFHNHQDYYRYKNMERKRRAVLTIDTDSSFLYLNPLLQTLDTIAPDQVDVNDSTSTVVNVNVVMYLATNVINDTYTRYGIEVGIPEEYTGRINMKNEFLLETLMVTTGKKHYASIVLMQEGVIYENPKVDIKGLAIKKTNTNPIVRKTLTGILEDEILKPKSVNVSKIVNRYRLLEEDIKRSLNAGETDYALPASVNNPMSYNNPLSIKAVRGTLLWNRLYPKEEITFPAKVGMVNLYITHEILNASTLSEEEKVLLREVLNNPSMVVNNEITVLAFPKGLKKIPEMFLPFIEIPTMVGANLSPGMPILNSAGGTILTSQGAIDISSNVIRM